MGERGGGTLPELVVFLEERVEGVRLSEAGLVGALGGGGGLGGEDTAGRGPLCPRLRSRQPVHAQDVSRIHKLVF